MGQDFTHKEKERISTQLEKQLSPEYLSVRTGFGNVQLTYVEGWLIISLANKIFGFDGWSSEIKSFTEEYIDVRGDKISVAYTCCCRVTLKNGIFKEDVGFGSAENQKTKGLAIEKAKKEATTDALKRALRQFGNALGNCCYDKEFLKNINKKGFGRPSLDSSKLLKKSDFDDTKIERDQSLSYDNELLDITNTDPSASKL